ncbi:MAG: PilZ domain-containing protein [Gammaproteobacteria bacterium]|nr:PilZ domain-containing protein [Gammaproteobacteria bacterium]
MDMTTLIYFIVGFVVVFIFSLNFFNEPAYSFIDKEQLANADPNDELIDPALPRYLTERFEFNLFRAAFILLTEFTYIILVLFLPEISSVAAAAENGGTAVAAEPQADLTQSGLREKIILATLIITGMAPNLPWIRNLLEKSKLYLHRQAQIPFKGRGIYHSIKKDPPKYADTVIAEILADQRYFDEHSPEARADLEADDFKPGPWSLEARWAKMAYLMHTMETWSGEFPFRKYMHTPDLKYVSIHDHYQRLQKMMLKFKRKTISAEERSRLETGVDANLNRIYRLISCLLYLAAKSDAAVDRYLDKLGYEGSEHNEFPIPWSTVVFISFSVTGSILLGGIFSIAILNFSGVPLPEQFGTSEIIWWNIYGIPFLIVPVLLVLLTKKYLSGHSNSWPSVTEQGYYHSTSERPWFIYFMVALCSYLVGALILFGMVTSFRYMQDKSIDYITIIQAALAWSLIVFLTAGYTAFRLDSGSLPKTSKAGYIASRIFGALSQGVTTAGLIYLVYLHTNDLRLDMIFQASQEIDPKIYVLTIIGFFLGVSVNVATGIGRLRQRRKHGRRKSRRLVQLDHDGQSCEARTVNVSDQGALISIDAASADWLKQTERNSLLQVLGLENHETTARVVHKRGNLLHLFFDNSSEWGSVYDDLLPAGSG